MIPCPLNKQACNEKEDPPSQVDYGLLAMPVISQRPSAPVVLPALHVPCPTDNARTAWAIDWADQRGARTSVYCSRKIAKMVGLRQEMGVTECPVDKDDSRCSDDQCLSIKHTRGYIRG